MRKVKFKRMKSHEDGVTKFIEEEKGHEIQAHGLRFFVTSEKATRAFVDIDAYDAQTGYWVGSLYLRVKISEAPARMKTYLESKRTKEEYESATARIAQHLKDLGFDCPLNP
jgi:hypothetical protein